MDENRELKKALDVKQTELGVDLRICEGEKKIQNPNGHDSMAGPRNRPLIDQISTGIVLVDLFHQIIDYNKGFENLVLGKEETSFRPNYLGADFYSLFDGHCEIDGPDFCPFATVKMTLRPTETTLIIGDRTVDMCVKAQICPETREISGYLVELTNSTKYTVLGKKIGRLQESGRKLTDLTADEIRRMSDAERKELIKCNIIDDFKQIFPYKVFEIRLLDKKTFRLEPFIAEGLTEEAKNRVLRAEATGNGTTGNVALFNKPYYCEDIQGDSFYLSGAENTRSTYTLPITYNNEVVGTFHLESSYPSDFPLGQQQLLKFFSDDIAEAIHILSMLSAENRKAAWEKVTNILEVVAIPFDQLIRNSFAARDLVCAYQKNQIFLFNSIKQQLDTTDLRSQGDYIRRLTIQAEEDLDHFVNEIGGSLTSIRNHCHSVKNVISLQKDELEDNNNALVIDKNMAALLRNRRILVIDKDDSILLSAHRSLEKMHCIVETASDALTALLMTQDVKYDAIITERIPLGGMDAEQFMIRIEKNYMENGVSKIPFIVSREPVSYDKGHVIAHCRLRGGKHVGIIQRSVPLIEHQLFNALYGAINVCCKKDENGDAILLPDTPNTLKVRGGIQLSLSGDTSDSTCGITGFQLQKYAKRFDQWVKQQVSSNPSGDENDPLMNLNALDAT